MSAQTSIQWTDRTWNPIRGCSRVSPGCDNCYAMRQARRFDRWGGPYEGLTRIGPSGVDWSGKVTLVESALMEPLWWRKPARVFVNSMSDLFHPAVPRPTIARIFAVMRGAPNLTFQILTKRAERMRAIVGDSDFEWEVEQAADEICVEQGFCHLNQDSPWPLTNVWLGVSCEDQQRADERIPLLLQTPAAIRFVSAEPLLGPVNVEPYVRNSTTHHFSADVQGMLRNRSFDGLTGDDGRPLSRREAEEGLWALHAKGVKLLRSTGECVGFSDQTGCPGHRHQRLDWVIVGGESGPGARRCDVAWIRSVVQQCQAARVPVFVKQIGGNAVVLCGQCGRSIGRGVRGGFVDMCGPTHAVLVGEAKSIRDPKGGDASEWTEDLRVREFPRSAVSA